MSDVLRAEASLRPGEVDLALGWRSPDRTRPAMRLVRRRETMPRGDRDGYLRVALDRVFRSAPVHPDALPWPTTLRLRYVLANAATDGGLAQAEVWLHFDGPPGTQAGRVEIEWFDEDAQAWESASVDDAQLAHSTSSPAPGVQRERLAITEDVGGVPTLRATLEVDTPAAIGASPIWRLLLPPEAPVEIGFDRAGLEVILAPGPAHTSESFEGRIACSEHDAPSLAAAVDPSAAGNAPAETLHAVFTDRYDPDSGEWDCSLAVVDRRVTGGTEYYYALFEHDAGPPPGFRTRRERTAAAFATGSHGLGERLYAMLPAVHRSMDEPSVDAPPGVLRRYLGLFGAGLDQARGYADGLPSRQDAASAPRAMLVPLAHEIGWEPDLTASELEQRRDIGFAPRVFESTGTLPNVRALVARVTGWPVRTKEFVHNVLRTNAPEELALWDLWSASHAGSALVGPQRDTGEAGGEVQDGRPSALLDSAGEIRVYFHSDRAGEWGIWMHRPAGGAPPEPVVPAAPGERHVNPSAVARGSEIWLFYQTRHDGDPALALRRLQVPAGLADPVDEPVTVRPGRDARPAGVVDAPGRVWVFWESDRRGPTDIWYRIHDGTGWTGPERRATTAVLRHATPAAALDDAGRVRLFYAADEGDGRVLYEQGSTDGESWSTPVPVAHPGAAARDEAPAAVLDGAVLRLYWHSNREPGRWNLWAALHDGSGWAAGPLTNGRFADKDPTALVDGTGALRLWWRSQRRGAELQSRTFDTGDPRLRAARGTLEDLGHYTFDAGTSNDDRYARSVVGIYLEPDTGDAAEIERRITRARDFVEPFRPALARYVWYTRRKRVTEVRPSVISVAHVERVRTARLLSVRWTDSIA